MKKFLLPAFIILTCISYISCSSSDGTNSISNASFANTRWLLRALNDKKVFIPEGGKEIFILFTNANNALKGHGGCNNFFGTYIKEKNNLKIGPVARTEMYCEHTMELENNFMKALELTVKYKIKGNYLYLYDATKLAAKLEAVYLN